MPFIYILAGGSWEEIVLSLRTQKSTTHHSERRRERERGKQNSPPLVDHRDSQALLLANGQINRLKSETGNHNFTAPGLYWNSEVKVMLRIMMTIL
ncbi:UNVERIFIED_CONTAM: hypothetical protein FKN15_019828 [Acipenser sinensis]